MSKVISSHRVSLQIPEPLREIGRHLRHTNRFTLPKHLSEIVEEFVDFQIENNSSSILVGSMFFRARILGIGTTEPFAPDQMGAPPPDRVSSGRINPDGIAYLYVAEKPETALAEVRPWKGAAVSVGRFETTRDISIVSISGVSGSTRAKGEQVDVMNLKIGAFLRAMFITNFYFAAPAHQDDRLAYLPSQYIAEAFKNKGLDGIRYDSVLHGGGRNLAIFDPTSAVCVETKSLHVRDVNYDAEAF